MAAKEMKANMEQAIRVRGVTKTFEDGAASVRALAGVDLDVASGEVLLLMGPSGSGKTTLLSVAGCILRPTSGSVKIRGREVTRLDERQLPGVRLQHIGFIFQGFNLFPALTAGENVELALDLKGHRGQGARRRAHELLEQVGLGEKHRSYPADLSGGQKQRVGIARALAGDPEIILADEPTAALDSVSGRAVIELLQDLAHARGRAVAIVTHDNRILPYADRIVHIEDGRIVEKADVRAIEGRGIHAGRGRCCEFLRLQDAAKFPGRRLIAPGGLEGAAMKHKLYVSLAALVFVSGSAAFVLRGHDKPSAQPAANNATARVDLIAAPGRIEPLSEDVKVGSEINGKLKTVLVEEGEHVMRGQLIAELENSDYAAQVASSEAQLREKEAELRKTVNGARAQERREALAAVKEAEAVMENARADMERRQRLYQAGVIAREEADRYDREFKVAQARYTAGLQRQALVDDEAREEDRSKAEAELTLARAQLDEVRARYEKTFIRAPMDGIVLRKHHRAGESVTNSSNSPDPVVTLGDREVLRVRVDVDETDVSKVRVGQRAYVTADAFRDRKFWGHIVRLGGELGRKNIRTDEPTERVDTKILETLIQLDDGHELPVGLRVDAFIVAD